MSTMEAAQLIRKVAEPRLVDDSVKAAIGRAARRLNWSFNRAKDVWYADHRIAISASEIDALRARTQEAKADADITARIERLEAYMLATDEEFHSADIDRLRALARRNRDQD